jgi:hypothetical protein
MWLVFGKILISILGKVIEPITGNRPIRVEFLALSGSMAALFGWRSAKRLFENVFADTCCRD